MLHKHCGFLAARVSVHLKMAQIIFEIKEVEVKQTSQVHDPINVRTHIQ